MQNCTIDGTEMQVTRTSLAIDTPTYRRLVDSARQNERSVSAEARFAIRRHLTEASAAQAANKEPVAAGAAGRGAAR
jgi:hypothetical protein